MTNLESMDATMRPVNRFANEPELSPAQRYGLLAAAIAAALLGLTTLDIDGRQALKHPTVAERTPECIVASALFVGAAPVQAP